MSKTYKKYIFVTSNNTSDDPISNESLETLFRSYTKLGGLKKRGIATPFLDILEIPEDLYNYIINYFTVKYGILSVAKSLIVFKHLNAKIFCLSWEELKESVLGYEETLKNLIDKTTQYLSDISAQIITIDRFKQMFLTDKEKK